MTTQDPYCLGDCDFVAKVLDRKFYCCDSCHEDDLYVNISGETGDYPMPEVYKDVHDIGSPYLRICCGVRDGLTDEDYEKIWKTKS